MLMIIPWEHTYAQFKEPTYALLLPAHPAWPPWIPLPICHPYEYLPLLGPDLQDAPDGQSLLGRVDLLRRIW